MATNILSSLTSKPSLSIVSNQTQIEFGTSLNVERVRVKFRSIAQRHMREDGTSIVDARIILPKQLEIYAFCSTLDDLALINAILIDRQSGYTITSKSLVFNNMMADENTIRQTPDCISANPIVLRFEEILLQDGAAAAQVAQAADSQTISQGIVSAASASLTDLANTVSAAASAATKAVSGTLIDAAGHVFQLDSSELG